ncbi:hypothetical protein LguiB_015323 [Lonicera macranthoides]
MPTGNNPSAPAIRQKRMSNSLCYIIVGIILQTLIVLVFVLTIMRIRNLKVRVGFANVENLSLNSSSNSPSFSIKLGAQVAIKNRNFGQYKFQRSNAIVSYRGNEVGDAVIYEGRARARSTKKVNVTLNLNSEKASRSASLVSDINAGKITLSTYARLNGKVHLFKVIKRKKSAQMNCTMDVNTQTKAIENLHCK